MSIKNNHLILGEIGFSFETLINSSEINKLYYPTEYFDENFKIFEKNYGLQNLDYLLFLIYSNRNKYEF